LRDYSGKLRGEFNEKHLRLYQLADGETQIQKRDAVVTTDARTNNGLKKKNICGGTIEKPMGVYKLVEYHHIAMTRKIEKVNWLHTRIA